jgi:hypothetical protein
MAGDFNKPTVNSTYVNFPVEIRDMFAEQAKLFDGTSTTNYPTNAIRWNNSNGRFEKYNGSTWGILISKYLIDVDTVDGYHAGNGSGAIPISNSTVCTNLNADLLDGYHAGNASGQVPVSNGTINVNLSADMLDGYHASNGAGNIPINNGTVCTNLNADMLDGYHASAFALLTGAGFTGTVTCTISSGNTLAARFQRPNNTNWGKVIMIEGTVAGGSDGPQIWWHSPSVAYWGTGCQHSSGAGFAFYAGGSDSTFGTERFLVQYGGGVRADSFQPYSSREVKDEIAPVEPGALSRVLKWDVCEFVYKDDEKKRRRIGMIAEDADDRIAAFSDKGKKDGLDLMNMVAELAAAVQELAGVRA